MAVLVTLLVAVVAQLGAQTPAATITVTGQVVAEATGQPIRRALVVAHSPSAKVTRATMSDLEGQFRFEDLPAGQYRVGASKAPYVAAVVEVGSDPAVVSLTMGAVITGVAVRPTGVPASGTEVQATGRSLPAPMVVSANGHGEFRLHSLPPGTYQVTPAGGGSVETIEVAGPGTHTIRALVVNPRVASGRPDLPPAVIDALAQRGQLPGMQQPPVGTSTISGRVVDIVSGASVPDVTVGLNGRLTEAVTDGAGHFRFTQLAAGTYTLRAQGSIVPVSSAVVTVEDDGVVDDVVVDIGQHGSISGTVRDDAGDPVVGMPVVAFRRQVLNFQPILMERGGRHTDDLGRFQLTGLPPGDYYLCACAGGGLPMDPQLLRALGPTAPSAAELSRVVDETVFVYPPTWFPGVTRGIDSPILTVDYSDDRLGLDITMYGTTPKAVTGRVGQPADGSVRQMSVYMVQEGDLPGAFGVSQLTPTTFSADGRFRFTGVPAGSYVAVAAPADGQPGPSGSAPVVVNEADVLDVFVPLDGGVSVTGRVAFRGSAALPDAELLKKARVSLGPLRFSTATIGDVVSRGVGYGATLNELGNFTIDGVRPGEYGVQVNISGSAWRTVESVLGGGQLNSDGILTVGPQGEAEVIVTMTDAPGATLTGEVTLGKYDAPTSMRVVVFPANRNLWTEPERHRARFPWAWVSRDRTFRLADVPPGEYLVALVSQLDFEMSVSKLERWADTARLVALNAGMTTEIALKK